MSLSRANGVTELTEIKRAFGSDALRDLRLAGIRIPPTRKFIVSFLLLFEQRMRQWLVVWMIFVDFLEYFVQFQFLVN